MDDLGYTINRLAQARLRWVRLFAFSCLLSAVCCLLPSFRIMDQATHRLARLVTFSIFS